MRIYIHKVLRIFQVLKYVCALIISKFYSLDNIWLLAERGTDARDNSYWLFIYLLKNCPDIKPYYAISLDSPDRKRLETYSESLVEYGSFMHYLIYCRAKALLSTHIYGYSPEPSLFLRLDKIFHINANKFSVMLQHGITKDYIPFLDYSNTNANLIVCGAKPEFDYMKEKFTYPDDNIQYLGFCRFDGLISEQSNEKYVLVMPTWRTWLNESNFKSSNYLKEYKDLLNNETLLTLLEEHSFKLIFYPHHEVQPYIDYFEVDKNNDIVIIADKYSYDVQDLLRRAAILITDYSSVFFDFAYMRKPVIYYQFDKDEYRAEHYAKGYFKYEDSFGPLTLELEDLINQLTSIIESGCEVENRYEEKISEYFPINDRNNCERTYQFVTSKIESHL
jgi:hypothetical protein